MLPIKITNGNNSLDGENTPQVRSTHYKRI